MKIARAICPARQPVLRLMGDIHAIFCWQFPLAGKIGHNPETLPARNLFYLLIAIIEQAYIPSEFIDDKAAYQAGILI